jgi:8-oxo-dGTP pyrophosphatase MutT (NUDIX family)
MLQGAVLLDSARACLARYQPSDAREALHHQRVLSLLQNPRPFAPDSYDPGHLTASAFVLSPARDAVLLILHRKLGIWIQPGGHVDATDASLADTARRELAEEVGLTLVPNGDADVFDLDVHTIPARKAAPQHEHFDVRFCFQAPSLRFAASSEVAGARWVALAEIDQLTGDESVLRAARKLLP